ncbi:DNRLRE domain-containing protein [Dyadobacter flavalbus]|uniref:DNRLRE domain-containing protein n=1 Tax=Dyadobacter flavalbus TaxID=2579942 RepID=A0A5M8QPV5_9BACT|nr:malectin domain-containing carbohydrate-binding protein [Dyadobacter flavalbus]KAA6437070.1 DNRLRE domain-containing protein [Dyadobacter flavalbus]
MSTTLLTSCRLPANAPGQLLLQTKSFTDNISSNKQIYSWIKPVLVLLLLFIFKDSLTAQPGIQWDRTIESDLKPGSNSNIFGTMQQTSDGGYILGGTTPGLNSRRNLYIVKLRPDGSKEWDKILATTPDNSHDDYYTTVLQTPDEGYLVGGYTAGTGTDKSQESNGGTDYWIIKLAANGTKQWDKTIGGTGYERLLSINTTADGGYQLSGQSPFYSSTPDLEIVNITSEGNVKSKLALDKYTNIDVSILKQTNDGGYIVGGNTILPEYDYRIIKLTALGKTEWDKTYGGSSTDSFKSVIQTSDGGYLLAGSSLSGKSRDKSEDSRGSYDYWIIKVDKNGTKQWDKTLGGSDSDGVSSIVQLADGSYLVGGGSYSPKSIDKTEDYKVEGGTEYGSDFWIIKLSPDGKAVWDRTIGATFNESLKYVQQTSDKGFVLGGQSDSPAGFDKTETGYSRYDRYSYWIVKLDAEQSQKVLTASTPSLLFTYKSGSMIPAQEITLSAGTSKQNLTFFKPEDSDWLKLPQATTTGPLSFSIDATGLAEGTYSTLVTITAPGYTRVQIPVKLLIVSEEAANTYLRINAGGDAYAASNGKQFKEDLYYAGTDRTSSVATGDIFNTMDDALYRTGRCSPSFSYNIPVANGKVNVVLHFAEIWFKEAGKRKFHVNIEGSRKLTDYDIYARAGGTMRAVKQTIPVTVTDGMLNIDFLTGSADQPRVSAIEVQVNSVSLKPIEDSYVRSGSYQYNNFGKETNLDVKNVDGSPDAKRMSYLRFTLASVGQVGSAKLRLYGYNYENAREVFLHAYGTEEGYDVPMWVESLLRYAFAPAASTPLLSSVGVTNVAKYYELDVTGYVKAKQQAGDLLINFLLRDDNARNSRLTFNSRENPVNPPQLVIQTVEQASAAARTGQQEITANLEKEPGQSTVFPNPATQHFNVELSGKHSENIDLNLVNQNGQSYKIQLPEKARAGQKVEVDISKHVLSTGVYMLMIKSEAVTEVIKMLITE